MRGSVLPSRCKANAYQPAKQSIQVIRSKVFFATAFRNGMAKIVFPAQTPQGRQHVTKRWFFFVAVPGTVGECDMTMTFLVERNDDQTVNDHGHGRRTTDSLLLPVRREQRDPLSIWLSGDETESWCVKEDVITGGQLAYPCPLIVDGRFVFSYDHKRRAARFVKVDLPVRAAGK